MATKRLFCTKITWAPLLSDMDTLPGAVAAIGAPGGAGYFPWRRVRLDFCPTVGGTETGLVPCILPLAARATS
jgi:hypothetical protein